MKVAYIMPHSYEYLFPEAVRSHLDPNFLDESILTKLDNYENRFCRASLIAGIEPTLYYFSNLTKRAEEFAHRDGYLMKKIPVNLRRGRLGSYGWEYSFSLLKHLSNDSFDLAFVFTYALNSLVWMDMYDLIAFHSKIKQYPLVARHGGGTANCYYRNNYSLPGRKLTKKIGLDFAARVIVGSKNEYRVLKENMKLPESKLIYLQDPVDLARFHPIDRTIACQRLSKDQRKRYVLYVGRLERNKGIQHLTNIFPRLKGLYPNLVLIIVGYGDYKAQLQMRALEVGVRDDVSFEGPVFDDALPHYYNIAEVLVLPSYAEAQPNVLQEALACNLPSVATHVGGIPDVLDDGIGLMVPPTDEDSLFRGIRDVLDGRFSINQEKRTKLLGAWQIDNFARTLKKIYSDIIWT